MKPDSAQRVWQGKKIGVTVEQWGENEREIVEHPGAVAIVAVDTEGRLAFVRQPREATRSRLLEIPAGTRETGEEPLATAQRELVEECGLSGGAWSRLGGFWTTPGFTREYMDVFLADGVEHGEAAPEADEDIEVVMLDPSDVGEIEDAKTLAALYLYFTSRATTRAR